MSDLLLPLSRTAALTLSLLLLAPTVQAEGGAAPMAEGGVESQRQQQPYPRTVALTPGDLTSEALISIALTPIALTSEALTPGALADSWATFPLETTAALGAVLRPTPQPEVSQSAFSVADTVPSAPGELLAQSPADDRAVETDSPEAVPPRDNLDNDEGLAEDDQPAILIEKIQVVGSTVFDEATLGAVLAPFEGQRLTTEDIKAAQDAVTQLYLDQGYFTSRALLLEQNVAESGVLTITVLERSADLNVEWIEGKHWIQESYIRDRIPSITPLNTLAVENELKLLRTNPLFESLEARLQRQPEAEADVLTIEVRETRNFDGNFTIDNESPPSIGGERFSLGLGVPNLSRRGDRLDATYRTTVTGGLQSLELAYEVPLNAKEGTISVQGNWDFTKVTQAPYDVFGIEGDRQRYSFTYRQPLIRTPVQELALFTGFTYTEGQTFIFGDIPTPFGIGPDGDGISRTSVVKIGQEYVRRDKHGAWVARMTQNFGTGWFGATDNPDPIPDGQFFSWLSQGQRIQAIGTDHLVVIQAELQLTPHSLLPSEQFLLGGRQSVRGYRQNALIGDNGFRLAVEDRITVRRDREGQPNLMLMPFLELGAVLNATGNPNSISSNQTVLAGTGLGVLWKPMENLDVRADYGLALVDWEQKGDNIQDHGFYFRTSYGF